MVPRRNEDRGGRLTVQRLSSASSWERCPTLDERLDHFRIYKVAIELIQLPQPEVVAVKVGVWRSILVSANTFSIGVVPDVAEVLHQHKCLVELTVMEGAILRN
jgi:hypothetical protein